MRIGYCEDWTGASRKVEIIDETISSYVCRYPPIEMTNINGKPYLAEPLTGLFLIDKKEIFSVKEE